jgi:DNA-binding response OmpR family regulator
MKQKILLLEDDVILNETVTEYLQDNGYAVKPAYDGYEASELMYEERFDLYLLDVKVPNQNGFEVLRQERENGKTVPAIFITSLNGVNDLEKGYESGCDDYLKKPFELKELLLRIQNILKRGYFHQTSNKITLSPDASYDIQNSILYVDNKEVKLAQKEHALLKLFLQNKDGLLAHEKIYDELWGYDENYSESALRTYIKTLRKYLGKDKIVSVKKLGYRFTSE